MSTVNNDAGDRSMTQEEHYANYLRYADAWHGRQQPFTASQQEAPPQYLPYAQYPKTTAQEEAGGMKKLPCYHVQTAQGQTYGVAATSVRDAMAMTQDRLSGESAGDRPVSAKRVDTWQADYGTVLHY